MNSPIASLTRVTLAALLSQHLACQCARMARPNKGHPAVWLAYLICAQGVGGFHPRAPTYRSEVSPVFNRAFSLRVLVVGFFSTGCKRCPVEWPFTLLVATAGERPYVLCSDPTVEHGRPSPRALELLPSKHGFNGGCSTRVDGRWPQNPRHP